MRFGQWKSYSWRISCRTCLDSDVPGKYLTATNLQRTRDSKQIRTFLYGSGTVKGCHPDGSSELAAYLKMRLNAPHSRKIVRFIGILCKHYESRRAIDRNYAR